MGAADPKAAAKKDEKEKPKKVEISPEMKALREKEKELEKVPQPDRKELEDASQVINDAINSLQEKLKAINEKITAKSAGKEEHFKARDEIKVMGDVPKMFEERETINAQIREKIMERNTLRDEFNTRQRAFSAYLNEMKKKEEGKEEAPKEEEEKDEATAEA